MTLLHIAAARIPGNVPPVYSSVEKFKSELISSTFEVQFQWVVRLELSVKDVLFASNVRKKNVYGGILLLRNLSHSLV